MTPFLVYLCTVFAPETEITECLRLAGTFWDPVFGPAPQFKQGHLIRAGCHSRECDQSGFEYLQGWRLCNLSIQPVLYSSCDLGFFIEMGIHVSSCTHCLFLCLWAPLTVDYKSLTISSHYAKITVCLTGNVFPIATPIAMNWLKKDRQQDQFSWWSVFPADIWWTRHCRKIYKSKAGNLSF